MPRIAIATSLLAGCASTTPPVYLPPSRVRIPAELAAPCPKPVASLPDDTMGTVLQVAVQNKNVALKCADQYEQLKAATRSLVSYDNAP